MVRPLAQPLVGGDAAWLVSPSAEIDLGDELRIDEHGSLALERYRRLRRPDGVRRFFGSARVWRVTAVPYVIFVSIPGAADWPNAC